MRRPLLVALTGLLALAPAARAGLYYSGEAFAELPSQWRGFLLDQRTLRTVAARPAGAAPANPARARYEQEAAKLAKAARERPLSADEAADLGALYARLGEVGKALEVLRPAQAAHPEHFRLAANLGTAWQLQGDLGQAAAALQQAVRLAPGRYEKAEALHLKLVRLRAREPRDAQGLDDLFGVRYVGPGGGYEPGRLAPEQRKRLPADAEALAQQLALWLPADGRLLWQLAELASAGGDVATAAAVMDGCVTEFGLRAPELLAHRKAQREAADERLRAAGPNPRAAHEGGHAGTLKARSSRPLARKVDQAPLPPVDPGGINALPWAVVNETSVDREYRPTFPKYLRELDGRKVQLAGYMQPLGDDLEVGAFLLIEFPVGCWYCEMPQLANIVLVEQPPGKTRHVTRGPVRVEGTLHLNATDPENFLYTVRGAKVTDAE
jgi:tetratricopeptide (TPR) repeat protein